MGARFFRTCPDLPWVPPSLLYNGYRVFPEGKERPGRDADSSPTFSAIGHERVELYLYSPYGPYGLYRTLLPVQGCTLPLLYLFFKWIYCRNIHLMIIRSAKDEIFFISSFFYLMINITIHPHLITVYRKCRRSNVQVYF